MSFDVKKIEQENIDVKKIIPVVVLFIFSIVGSMVFVYYYFSFEKNAIMQEHYLGADSKIKASYEVKEKGKLNNLDMKSANKAIINRYGN